VQLAFVTWLIQERVGRLDWRGLGRSAWQTCTAAAVMSFVCVVAADFCPTGLSWQRRLVSVFVPIAASLAAYFAVARMLGMNEIADLFRTAGDAAE